jgi:signal transduction histidine kinase
MKDYSSGVAKIAFADRTSEIEIMTNLVKTSVFYGLFTLSSFFAISFFLAKWAVKPIKKSWEQQTQFVADASHELKTP